MYRLLERIGSTSKRGGRRCGRTWPGMTIIIIMTPFSAYGFAIGLQQVTVPNADVTGKAIHSPLLLTSHRRFKIFGGCQPAFVPMIGQTARFNERLNCRSSRSAGSIASRDPNSVVTFQLSAVALGAHEVFDRYAPASLFESKVTLIGEYECKFLFVIWPALAFPKAFTQHNPDILRPGIPKGSDGVVQLVIWDIQPAPVGKRRGVLCKLGQKYARQLSLQSVGRVCDAQSTR